MSIVLFLTAAIAFAASFLLGGSVPLLALGVFLLGTAAAGVLSPDEDEDEDEEDEYLA